MKITFTLKPLPFFFLFVLFANLIYSQVNQWTWIKGDSIIKQAGRYGNLGNPDALNKPGSRYHPVGWTDNSGAMWLFGGSGYANDTTIGTFDGSLNDLWKYDINSSKWTWVKGDSIIDVLGIYGTQGIPSVINKPRGRRQAVSWLDKQNNLWLFGGATYNDLWKYNINSNQWTWMKGGNANLFLFSRGVYGIKGIPANANTPGGRYGSASWVDNSGNLWLFGGFGSTSTTNQTDLNDLWKYDVTTNQWTWKSGDTVGAINGSYGQLGISSPLNKPGARWESFYWTDSLNNFWLLGGYGVAANPFSYGCLNDLWKFNTTTNEWTWVKGDSTTFASNSYGIKGIANSSNKPGGRIKGGSWADTRGNLWLYGGGGCGQFYLSDLWRYNIASNNWTWVGGDSTGGMTGEYGQLGIASSTTHPGSKYADVSWLDKNGNFWLFGGAGYARGSVAGFLNDLWKYTPNDALPVTLIFFTGKLQNNKIGLQWKVENEQNFDRYVIERSFSAADFKKIGEVKATNVGQYNYNDDLNELRVSKVYYRLKELDKDGKFNYSQVIEFQISSDSKFTIYPNPASAYFQLRLNKNISGKITVEITNVTGKLIVRKLFDVNSFNITLSTNKLASGTYVVKIIYRDEQYLQKVVIVK